MEGIETIRLSEVTPNKLEKIPDGVKIFDKETQKYYEKIDGKFQEMIEENTSEPKEEELSVIPDTAAELDELVKSGNKLMEVNTFMQLKSIRNELTSQLETVNMKINFMFDGTPDQIDIIQSRVSEVKKEALEKATFDELKPFFVFEDKPVKLNFDPLLDEKEKEDAHREFLIYLKETDTIRKEIESRIKELDDLCTHFSEEVLENSKDVYKWDRYIYSIFKDKLEEANLTPDERVRIERLIKVKDDAITLKPIYDAVKAEIDQGKRRSMINAYKTRLNDTVKKAEQYAMKNNFHVYFQLFDNIEEEFGYENYRNLFAYVFARYIKFNADKLSKIDNAFIAQISQNLIMLKKNQLPPDVKQKFTNAIKSIEDLIVKF